jgi:hypothetical protein
MLTVWRNATETEVYALALLLAILMIVTGEAAGRRDSRKLRILLAYLTALAVALHLSALMAAPAAIMLATTKPGRILPDARWIAVLGGALTAVIGFSLGAMWLVLLGMIALVWSAIGRSTGGDRARPLAVALAVVGGLSVTAFMLVRAPHDPFVNQGDPSTLGRMLDVVWREQYSALSLWERRTPAWIQMFNFVQYADWQVASGLDDTPTASWWRTPVSLTAFMLAVVGVRWLWREDRRAAFAMMLLFTAASVGVVTILNMPPGASTPDVFLAAGARRQPRDVDYFFALAFAALGPWIGAGAFSVARRSLAAGGMRWVSLATIGVSALPVILNWRAADRAVPGEAALAPMVGAALLASAPPDAVLFLARDNDTYLVWYRQAVLGERRDVVPVSTSLLGAQWYRAEQARRHRLLDVGPVEDWLGQEATIEEIVKSAGAQGRAVAVPLSMAPAEGALIARRWTLRGLVLVAKPDTSETEDGIDRIETARVSDLVATTLAANPSSASDPGVEWASGLLGCPARVLEGVPGKAVASLAESLAALCNLR